MIYIVTYLAGVIVTLLAAAVQRGRCLADPVVVSYRSCLYCARWPRSGCDRHGAASIPAIAHSGIVGLYALLSWGGLVAVGVGLAFDAIQRAALERETHRRALLAEQAAAEREVDRIAKEL